MGTIVGGYINPSYLSPQAWYDFSDASTITLVGSNISQINDKSTHGRNLTQGTAGRRPTLSTASQNGLDTASFDGGDSLAASTAADWTFLHNGTDYIIAMAVRPGVISDPNAVYALLATNNLSSASHGFWLTYDDRASVPRNNVLNHAIARNVSGNQTVSNISADGAITPNAYSVITVFARPSNGTAANRSSMIVNTGTAIANNALTNAASATAPLGALTIGNSVDQTSFPFTGNFCELVIVSGANATAANATELRAYLKHKWAI